MGIFSLPAEPTRCSDSLLWFAPPPWSPLRLTPCSLELATLALVSDTLVPPSLLPLPSPPPPTPLPLPSASPPPVSTLPTSPSPATPELSLLPPPSPPLPLLPLVSLEATPPLEATTARGRLRQSPTLATPVSATLDSDTATLVSTATASLLPASTPPTSPSLAGDSTKQTSIANF